MISLRTKLHVFLLFSMVVSVLGDITIILRVNNDIKLWNSSSPYILKNLYSPLEVYSLACEELDITRNVYIMGEIQPPQLCLLNIITTVHLEVILPQDGAGRLISMVSNNGFVYVLTQSIVPNAVLIYEIDIDASFLKNVVVFKEMNKAQESKYNFLPGNPLGYDSTTRQFYTEVQQDQKLRTMVEIVISNSTTTPNNLIVNSLDWITGWTKLWYLPSCPKQLVGFIKGSIYSIDIANNQANLLFSPSTLVDDFDQDPQLDVDPSTGHVYTLSRQDWHLVSFTFIGKALGVNDIPSIIGNAHGLQIIPEKSGIIGTCPFTVSSDSPSSLDNWLSNYGLIIIIALGAGFILVALICAIMIFNMSKRSKYSEILDVDRTIAKGATEALHDALHASGGQIEASEIELKDQIGHGSFANVYHGIFHETEVAIKVIKFISMRDMEKSLLEEAGLMVKLRHPHIVLFMGACIKPPDLFIVTEFLENGSVRELLDERSAYIEEEHVRAMSIDACKGMAYLHSRNILHRDLKTHNLLVDKFWNVKVADFGLSRAMGEVDGTMTACGTPSWAAPEVLRRDHYSFKADVYSFGVCLWEMCTRERPYSDLKPFQVVIAVATNGLRPIIDPTVISPSFEKLLKLTWNDKPDERPNFPKVREILEDISCPPPSTPTPSYNKQREMKTTSAPVLSETPRSSEIKKRY